MAFLVQFLVLFPLVFFVNASFSHIPFLPNSVILPVTKDSATLQYVTEVYMGGADVSASPPVNLVVDLGGRFLWVDCGSTTLSTHHPVRCSSLKCSKARGSGCARPGGGGGGLDTETCTTHPENSIRGMAAAGDLAQGTIALEFTDGVNTGSVGSIYQFLFSCAPSLLVQGLASGVKGVLGLGNSRVALPSQLANTFGFQRKFAMCLSSSNGVLFSGNGPYVSLSGHDITKSLVYTPLVINQDGNLEEYHINVKSIKVNNIKLSINQEGVGGAKISTTVPYTTMESTIYSSFVDTYAKVAASLNMTRAAPVAPFEVCFSSRSIDSSRNWQDIPTIDLVLQSEMVKWRLQGKNSMVQVSDEVMCLGLLNGGRDQKSSIVIGGHQLEDNFLEFNLASSMLGFTSLLSKGHISCSDFKLHAMPKESH